MKRLTMSSNSIAWRELREGPIWTSIDFREGSTAFDHSPYEAFWLNWSARRSLQSWAGRSLPAARRTANSRDLVECLALCEFCRLKGRALDPVRVLHREPIEDRHHWHLSPTGTGHLHEHHEARLQHRGSSEPVRSSYSRRIFAHTVEGLASQSGWQVGYIIVFVSHMTISHSRRK